MRFTEKEIEAVRKAALMEEHKSIHHEYIYVGGERLEFEEEDLFYPFVRIMLPKTFLKLPDAFAKKMYPSEYRPEVIRTNPSMTVHFAFSYFDARIRMEEVIPCTHYYLDSLRRMYPGNRYLENSEHFMDEERKRILGWYAFSNPTLDGRRCNIHAFTEMEGRLLFCIFNSSKELFEEWKPHALEVFDSVVSGRVVGGKRG